MSFKLSYSFLDIKQKSHYQVVFAQESCSNNLLVSDEVHKSTLYNINSNIAQKQVACQE